MKKTLTLNLNDRIWQELRRKAIHESNSTNPDIEAVIENIIKNYYESRD